MSNFGVIFTDTCVLADKYNCRRQEVIYIIESYIRRCSYRGFDWHLVDVGGHDFDYIFSHDVTWQGYCQALADNCAGMGWQTDCNTPLFIIGGDDVIPVPIVLYQVPDEKELTHLQVDTLYCYPPGFNLLRELDRFDANGYCKGELYKYFMSKAVFHVSRLPIESGDMKTTIRQDLGAYFERCSATGGTITIDNLLPVTGFQWYFSTLKIVENMPLLPLGPSNGCHMGDIFVSPLLRMDDSTAMAEFIPALGKADMLMLKLHGHYRPEISGFFGQSDVPIGDDEEGDPIYEQPPAFGIGLLPKSNALIFNTEACFGARYIEYPRVQSMLLTALYHSQVLLYMGSCVSAWYIQPLLGPETGVNDLKLVNLSDEWFKTYLNLQMQGDMAGLAMLKAKWLYYDECGNGKNWATRLTILEFNQFGEPTLSVRAPRYNRFSAPSFMSNLRHGSEKVKPFKEKYTPVYSRTSLNGLDSLYDDVRSSVDVALMRLSDDLRRMLSDDYHYPAHHFNLSSISREDTSGGYLFKYAHHGRDKSQHAIYVSVDGGGKVKNIIYRM